MKRILTLLLSCLLCLCLVGCAKAVSGTYKLDYITTDGVRVSPSTLGLNMSFELLEDGIGTATYGPATVDLTWVEEGNELLISSENQELRFSRDGNTLVLHDDGTMLFFTLAEEEKEDK